MRDYRFPRAVNSARNDGKMNFLVRTQGIAINIATIPQAQDSIALILSARLPLPQGF